MEIFNLLRLTEQHISFFEKLDSLIYDFTYDESQTLDLITRLEYLSEVSLPLLDKEIRSNFITLEREKVKAYLEEVRVKILEHSSDIDVLAPDDYDHKAYLLEERKPDRSAILYFGLLTLVRKVYVMISSLYYLKGFGRFDLPKNSSDLSDIATQEIFGNVGPFDSGVHQEAPLPQEITATVYYLMLYILHRVSGVHISLDYGPAEEKDYLRKLFYRINEGESNLESKVDIDYLTTFYTPKSVSRTSLKEYLYPSKIFGLKSREVSRIIPTLKDYFSNHPNYQDILSEMEELENNLDGYFGIES